MRKNIFVITQNTVEPYFGEWAKEAASEFMGMFPEYKDDYPVRDIGNWSSARKTVNHAEYMRLSEEKRSLCIPMTDGSFLVPFESTDWAMAMAKLSARNEGEPSGYINADRLLDLMSQDPTVRQIPQININLVNDEIYAHNSEGQKYQVYGFGRPDKEEKLSVGAVLSVRHLKETYGDNPEYMKEVFKTLVMHELGHVFGATWEMRNHVSNRDGCGQHCTCPNCIMRTTHGRSGNEKLTDDRLNNKRNGAPPLCPECHATVSVYMAQLSRDQQKMNQAQEYFNRISRMPSGRW